MCRTDIICGTPKDSSLKIDLLPLNKSFSNKNVLQNGLNALSKFYLKKKIFVKKTQNFGLYDLVYVLPACGPSIYQIMYGEALDLTVSAFPTVARKSFNGI